MNTVPGIPSRRVAVASSPEDEHDAISPAPTNVTDPGGSGVVTTIDAVPVLPPAAADIVAVPLPAPVTRPLWLTVATALLDDDHTNVNALAGVVSAVSCCVAPTTIDALDGVTATERIFGDVGFTS